MDTLLMDVRYAVRQLKKAPGLTIVAVLSLALGIGANTALYQIADRVLLRPLPVTDPSRLVTVVDGPPESGRTYESSYREFLTYRREATAFSDLAASSGTTLALSGELATARVAAEMVTPNYFRVLGIAPAAGRWLVGDVSDRAVPGDAEPAVVLADRVWRSAFGADPRVIGKTVKLNGAPFTVVGIAPAGFVGNDLGAAADVWIPLLAQPLIATGAQSPTQFDRTSDQSRWLRITGRLRPGATIASAGASLLTVRQRLYDPALHGDNPPTVSAVSTLSAVITGGRADLNKFLVLLLAVVGLTLLIACANLATLLLARGAARTQEMGVRAALGAARGRLVRQLVTESAVLALLGGAAGVLVASWTTDLLRPYVLPGGVRVDAVATGLNGGTIIVAFALSLLTSLLVGLAPAIAATGRDAAPVMHVRASTETRGQSRLRGWLVTAQVALALVLLAGAGLFGRSLRNALALDTGFRVDDIGLLTFNLGEQRYTRERAATFYRELRNQSLAIPGVRGAAVARLVPVEAAGMRSSVLLPGRPQSDSPGEISFNVVGDGFLETMGIPVVRGRTFGESDDERVAPVAIVNEALARRLWPNEDPIGQRFVRGSFARPPFTVVGVARDSKYRSLREDRLMYFYLPLAQNYDNAGLARMNLVLRSAGRVDAALVGASSVLRAMDPELPVHRSETMTAHLGALLMPQRMGTTVLGFLSLLGVILAVTGIYGVVAYAVARRTREIGVRMALGARGADVVRLVLGQGVVHVVLGVAAGAIVVASASTLAASFMYGVSATDTATIALAAVILAGTSLLAMLVPAWRATRIEPVAALRGE
ncbi:MAG: ABC transporter permease [Gemmatimonadaceae bacterium]